MKKLTLFTLTLVLTAAMALTPATAQQYVHTDTLTGHTKSVEWITFKDNGTLISGGADDTLRAWDVTTGRQRWEQNVGDGVATVALPSHNPHFIAYGGWPDNFDIRMRYSDDGDWRGEVAGHTNSVSSLAFKPNSYLLASGGDYTIRIWDVGDNTNLRHVRTLRGHTDFVYSVAWSPDGRTLASASRDGTVRLWNPNNGINFAVLRGAYEGGNGRGVESGWPHPRECELGHNRPPLGSGYARHPARATETWGRCFWVSVPSGWADAGEWE